MAKYEAKWWKLFSVPLRRKGQLKTKFVEPGRVPGKNFFVHGAIDYWKAAEERKFG